MMGGKFVFISKYGLVCELPGFSETGNVWYNAEHSRENIEKLISTRNLNGFIEPNVESGSTMLEVSTIEVAKELNPWNGSYTKCDALHTTKQFLKENNFALFGRSADCMMLALLSTTDVYLFHLSVASLNNGILRHLPTDTGKKYLAIEGPCISDCYYFLKGERIKINTSHYEELGYLENTYYEDEKLHVNIRGIVRSELKKHGIRTVVNNDACTYCNMHLGSNRRDGPNRHDNVMIIK